ncbi:MAG: PEGA domain-containing protein [Candidatus Aminicenantes bacterium]|nr:PEGA domain-containing protein [Candidatus Aminicenantes bacterium]
MKKSIAVLCIISFLSLSGCATLFKGTSEKVNMESSPVRADVYVNGQFMGKTPMQLNLAVKRSYAIEFRAKGYQSRTYHINNRVGAGWVILDVLLGLVPVIVDAATGAWYHLDQKNIDAVLVEQQP